MKKILILGLHYIFFITTLLFLEEPVALLISILLLSILILDKFYYSVLPLVLCIKFIPTISFILISIFICNIILYIFIKKNRYYALTIFILSIVLANFILVITNTYKLEYLNLSLLLLVIYSIINYLHTFKQTNNKNYILPYNQKLISLTLLLFYLIIILYYKLPTTFILFLFMQFFIIKDHKYTIIFSLIYSILLLLFSKEQLPLVLNALAVSYFPPAILLTFKYDTYIYIIPIIYTIIVTFINIKTKKTSLELDYMNSLFQDFSKYIELLSYEFNKSTLLKTIKKEKIEYISQNYCNICHKNTICKTNINKRYTFLSSAMMGVTNTYDCPYYSEFDLNQNLEVKTTSMEYSGIKALSEEINFIYNQSLLLKNEYNNFITLINEYGYEITNIDIHLSSKTIFFTLYFTKDKQIIESLFLKLAYKAFGEKIDIKIIEDNDQIIVHFFKTPEIKITYAHTVLAKNNNLMSGDNYYIKKDYNSSYIFALSDGMGSGYNAYIESVDALKTITTLTSYHFSIKTILRLLEDVYELKSNYDRYATLDFLYINTANRKLNLYKMGSTTTYILHNHKLLSYDNKALPLKLDEVNSAYEIDIYSGDYIFLLSDGISDFITKDEFYSLVSNGTDSVDVMCDKIIQYIKKKQQDELKDDLSLIAIKAI